MTGIPAKIRRWLAPRPGKTSNGDGTFTERWPCGCTSTGDYTDGRILSAHLCRRHRHGKTS